MFADVILPLAVQKDYTYHVPVHLTEQCCIGVRVVVEFGRNKMYTGIIKRLHTEQPEYQTKDLLSVLDDIPVVTQTQLLFWTWIAEYYLCTEGEIYKAALPSGLKLESETFVSATDAADEDILSERENELIQAIKNNDNKISISKLQNIFSFNILPLLKKLVEAKLLNTSETLKQNYQVKTETYIRVNPQLQNDSYLAGTLKTISRAKKQAQLLMDVLYLTRYGSQKHAGLSPAEKFRKSDIVLHAECSSSTIKSLTEKGLLIEEELEIGRLSKFTGATHESSTLNSAQTEALNQIEQYFTEKEVVLLHGVTSSGKTEIYIELIKRQLEKGKQVLYLLPEIALTAQIINRLTGVFGKQVGVYHSKFNDAERVELWKNLCETDEINIILGVRSSVFLPMNRLGLIIVDEEHENTYKQFDPAPRYHARDSAIYLAKLSNSKVLLGTATPSIESYFNVKQNKFGLVNLSTRYGDIRLPEIMIADVRHARKRKAMKSMFTPELYQHISQTLATKEQVILFQNRRGYAPFMECDECAYVPKCEHCDVSLTLHKHSGQLVCHYCGYTEPSQAECKACGNISMQSRGFGTEQIESEAAMLFPEAKIARMDTDTTRSRKAFIELISDFETGRIDILIGTQMISKGLDFDKVKVVGIMNADAMLNYPDFRAYERSFQLMTQVAGRAGRRDTQGIVVIQTTDKQNPILRMIVDGNFNLMFETQLVERKQYKYPPYFRLVRLSVKHQKYYVADQAADALADLLRNSFGKSVLGPEYPPVPRIKDRYIKQILIKIEKSQSPAATKKFITAAIAHIKSKDTFRSVVFVSDVDPM